MKGNLNNKYLRFVMLVIGVMLVMGACSLARNFREGGSVSQAVPGIPLDQAQRDLQVAQDAAEQRGREEGQQEGFEAGIDTAVAPASIPQVAVARNAALSSATGQTFSDLESLVCARAAQYLSSADDAKWSQNIDPERWLQDQLKLENDRVLEVVGTGSVDGSSETMNSVSQPLINRAAITEALDQITQSRQRNCRLSVFESDEVIQRYLRAANRVQFNMPDIAQPEAEDE